MTIWLVTSTALVVSLLLTGVLIGWLRRLDVMDKPNERSSHEIPTPRGGGLGILGALLAAAGVAAWVGLPLPPWNLTVAVLAVAAVGMLDDHRHVSSAARLAVHLGAALLIAIPAGGLARLPLPAPLPAPLDGMLPAPVGVALAVLWLVAVLNFVNFMDGIDGITGLQLLVAGLALAILHQQVRAVGAWGWLGYALAAACLGFLVYNWRWRRPARVFLGDVGSGSLGLLVAAAPFTWEPAATWEPVATSDLAAGWGDAAPASAILAAVLVPYVALFLWPFLADATFTLLRRLRRGERIWQAHRSHLYQRLVQAGASHAAVATSVGALAVSTTVLAFHWQADWRALAVAVVLSMLQWCLTCWCEQRARRSG